MKRYKTLKEAYEGGKNKGKYHTTDDNNEYWGNQGAGIIVCYNQDILLGLRSKYVNEPHTWNYVGGKIDVNEDPKKACIRELAEESGIRVKPKDVKYFHTYIDKDNNFKYYTYIVEVNEKYKTTTDWENDRFEWFDINSLPSPLHFGLKKIVPLLKRYLK